jgi:hypothetical protein
MAFGGYDFYQQGRTVAGPGGFGSSIPPEGQPLDEYLVDRLLDSLDLNGRTFLDWWATLHLLPKLGRVATVTLLANLGSFFSGPVGAAVGAFIGTKADIFDFGGPKLCWREPTRSGRASSRDSMSKRHGRSDSSTGMKPTCSTSIRFSPSATPTTDSAPQPLKCGTTRKETAHNRLAWTFEERSSSSRDSLTTGSRAYSPRSTSAECRHFNWLPC